MSDSSIQAWIDENLDHRMILRRDDPLVEAIEALGQHAYLIDDNPTTENLARLVYEQDRNPRLPRNRRHPLGNPRLLRHLRPNPRPTNQRPPRDPGIRRRPVEAVREPPSSFPGADRTHVPPPLFL